MHLLCEASSPNKLRSLHPSSHKFRFGKFTFENSWESNQQEIFRESSNTESNSIHFKSRQAKVSPKSKPSYPAFGYRLKLTCISYTPTSLHQNYSRTTWVSHSISETTGMRYQVAVTGRYYSERFVNFNTLYLFAVQPVQSI